MGYGYTSDAQERRGFIDKTKILEYVTEEQIFSLVFGYLPVEFEYVTSPFRKDTSPGSWFERRSDTLRFIDFASKRKMFPDCFDAVQIYFKLPNFYRTLEFIYDKLIAGKNLPKREPVLQEQAERKRVQLYIQARKFLPKDGDFWGPYGITRQQLMDDSVFAVSNYTIVNSKGEVNNIVVNRPSYAYTEFEEGRKKIYIPENPKEHRFITNCTRSDIGGINSIPLYGEQLIITKSYKDCRVIRNLARPCVWFQNEGVIPERDILHSLIKRFTRVIVFYDNDATGIEQSLAVSDTINHSFPGKSRPLWLPEHLQEKGITDPADLRKAEGEQSVRDFFKHHLI